MLTVGGFEPGLVDYAAAQGASRVSPTSSPSLSLSRSSDGTPGGDTSRSHSSSSSSSSSGGLSFETEGDTGTTPDATSLIAWTSITSRAAYRVKIAKMEADGVELGVGEAAFGKTLVDSG